MDATQMTQLKDQVAKAQSILIVTHEQPTADSIGASLALYLGLLNLGKKVTVVCPDPMTVGLSSFIGVNKIVKELGNKNFVISLDYVEGSIEKVSYNIADNKFNLIIEPRVGFDAFSEDKVHYTHQGTQADMIFAIDTIHLGGLKTIYDTQKELFASKPIVNVDRHPNNALYGTTNWVESTASSTTELVAKLLSGLGVQLTIDIAANLLNGLYGATENFQSQSVSPVTFEVAALCMKAGAKRFTSGQPAVSPVMRTPQASGAPTPTPSPRPSVPVQPVQSTVPSVPTVQEERPVREVSTTHSAESVSMPTEGVPVAAKMPEAPSDWLKPKIFKSSN